MVCFFYASYIEEISKIVEACKVDTHPYLAGSLCDLHCSSASCCRGGNTFATIFLNNLDVY